MKTSFKVGDVVRIITNFEIWGSEVGIGKTYEVRDRLAIVVGSPGDTINTSIDDINLQPDEYAVVIQGFPNTKRFLSIYELESIDD